MSESVSLPALGESVTEGTVTRWLKQVGDRVEVDEPLLEVSTDKVDTEIPSPVAGTIEQILVAEDETVEVGAPLVVIGDGSGGGDQGGAPAAADAPSQDAPAQDAPAQDAPAQDAPAQDAPAPDAPAPDAPVYAAPAPADQVAARDEPPVQQSPDQSASPEQPAPAEHTAQPAEVPAAGFSSAAPTQVVTPAHQADAPSAPADEQAPLETPQESPEQQADEAGAGTTAAAEAENAETTVEGTAPQVVGAPAEPAPASTTASGDGDTSHAGYVTPIVRKLAHDRGIDLSTVTGTGVGGRIRKQDVMDAAERASAPAPAAAAEETPAASAAAVATGPEISPLRGTTVPMSRLRKVVAERAVVSMQTTAQLTTVVEADVTKIARLRDRVKAEFLEKTGTKLSFLPFFTLAAAEALKTYPIINATVDGDSIVYPDHENVSIAVDTERGLLTPVVRNASELSIADLSKEIADLAGRTRENKLKPDELSGGTFTVTNTGSRGALFDTPLVFLPQVAILGTGVVVKKPLVITQDGADAIAVRSTVYLALSYDHRIVDGADAARFLTAVKTRLETADFEGNLGI